MDDLEQKVIEIKNANDTEIKDKLSVNPPSRLTSNDEASFNTAFHQHIKYAGVDIFDDKNSVLIRQGEQLTIAKRNADGTMIPVLAIDGGTWDKTRELTINFITYLINKGPLRTFYKETMINIAENKEVTSLIATTKESLADITKEVPTKERIKSLIWAVDKKCKDTEEIIKSHRKNAFKLKTNEQERINMEILGKILAGYQRDLRYINHGFLQITGIDAVDGKNDPTLEKDLRDPVYGEIFIEYNSSLYNANDKLSALIKLASSEKFVTGQEQLSEKELIDFGIYGVDQIETLSKLLLIHKNIDKERVEAMMKVAMIQLEDEDYQALFDYLKAVAENQKDPTKEPFVVQNVQKVKELVDMYPFLKDYGLLSIIKKNKGEAEEEEQKDLKKNGSVDYVALEANEGNTSKESADTKTDPNLASADSKKEDAPNYGGMGLRETFKKGGIKGSVRKIFDVFPQMSESTKNTWTSLLITGGVGFGIFKLGKWLFTGRFGKKGAGKDTPFRQRMLIVGGVTLGFNAFGSNPFKFAGQLIGGGLDPGALKMDFSKLGFLGGSKTNDEKAQENGEIDTRGVLEVFGKTPVNKLSTYIDSKTMELTEGGYNGLLAYFTALEEETTSESDKANYRNKKDLVQKIRKNKGNGILKNSFAAMAITPDNMNTLSGTVLDQATRNISVDGGKEVRDGKDDANITDQVKSFSSLSEPQKAILIKYGNLLYDQKPSSSDQKVEFKEDGNQIKLKTYGERTPIGTKTEIGQLSIEGLTNAGTPIVFKDYTELLKAANLTNYIKSLYRGKSTGNLYKPFEKGSITTLRNRGDIVHKNSDTEKKSISDYFDFDKEAISTGRLGTLKNVSPVLNDNVASYVDYLNELNIWSETKKNEKKPQ